MTAKEAKTNFLSAQSGRSRWSADPLDRGAQRSARRRPFPPVKPSARSVTHHQLLPKCDVGRSQRRRRVCNHSSVASRSAEEVVSADQQASGIADFQNQLRTSCASSSFEGAARSMIHHLVRHARFPTSRDRGTRRLTVSPAPSVSTHYHLLRSSRRPPAPRAPSSRLRPRAPSILLRPPRPRAPPRPRLLRLGLRLHSHHLSRHHRLFRCRLGLDAIATALGNAPPHTQQGSGSLAARAAGATNGLPSMKGAIRMPLPFSRPSRPVAGQPLIADPMPQSGRAKSARIYAQLVGLDTYSRRQYSLPNLFLQLS